MRHGQLLVVVDTNLFVSALFVGSRTAMAMLEGILGTAVPVFCPETLAELEAKSLMAKFDRYIPKDERVEAVKSLKVFALTVESGEPVRICRDPKDDIFLALARTVRADGLFQETGICWFWSSLKEFPFSLQGNGMTSWRRVGKASRKFENSSSSDYGFITV
ncbi:MAG: putative toxin-antitoxin system toxin component, PIN family [Verrucomicrobiaceae bacterium]|nr:MAG: putative toxin-antitoxin system toxin component, PIN family [Verrucomicrobiaceae bacterium]